MVLKKIAEPVIIVIILFFTCPASGQNFVLPGGEYMDTTSNANTKCKDYHAYYYQVGGKYPKSSFSLLKDVHTFLERENKTDTAGGYITFRFTIDCEGKMLPKVQVLQTDEKYRPFHFYKELVNELFAFLKTLDKWKTAKTKDGEAFSYKAFITFKIENGKIINIIP